MISCLLLFTPLCNSLSTYVGWSLGTCFWWIEYSKSNRMSIPRVSFERSWLRLSCWLPLMNQTVRWRGPWDKELKTASVQQPLRNLIPPVTISVSWEIDSAPVIFQVRLQTQLTPRAILWEPLSYPVHRLLTQRHEEIINFVVSSYEF